MILSSRVVKANRLAMGQNALKILAKSNQDLTLDVEVTTRVGQMVARAQREAEAILEEAQEQAKLILESARTRGYQEGMEKGLAQSRGQWQAMAESLQALLDKMGILGRLSDALYQEETLSVAGAIVVRLFPLLADRDPGVVTGYIQDAINLLDENTVRIFVSSKWEPYVTKLVNRLQTDVSAVTVAVDHMLGWDEWRIEGDRGGILAGPVSSVDTVINEVMHGLGEHPFANR
jgi:flagellar biosynthesis/type III secretory pathway protein FliH